MSTININQFAQVPVRGELDLQIAKSGIFSGIVSANSAAIVAGDDVILDEAITVAGTLQFRLALYTEVAMGFAILDPRAATVATPGAIQVASRLTGPVMWLIAGATIAPGALVEQVNSASYDVQTLAAGKLRGMALDYATIGQLTRVLLAQALV